MRIFDSVHGLMDFSEFKEAKMIVDTPLFQRLRHIKQLGVTEILFPSATHTRFSHSLGAAHLSLKIMDRFDISDRTRTEVFYAALLHDIGHGPFSHVFEQVFSKILSFPLRHELWTYRFIKEGIEQNGWFYDMYNEEGDAFIKRLCGYISHSTYKQPLSFATDIISSQIDVDRMDYLLRDSYHCGVTYGLFDTEWLIDSLRIFKVDGKRRLGIHEKGIGALEQYLLARRMITEYIYTLPKSRSYEKLIIFLLKEIYEIISTNSIPNIQNFISSVLFEFMNFKNKCYQTQEDFINDKFDSYKKLTDIDIWFTIRGILENQKHCSKKLYSLAEAIYYRKLPKIVYDESLSESDTMQVRQMRKEYNIESWDLFRDESSICTYENRLDPIYIIDRSDSILTLDEVSPLMAKLANEVTSKNNVYISKRAAKAIHKNR